MSDTFDPIEETIKLAEEFAAKRELNNDRYVRDTRNALYNRDVDLYITVSHNLRMEDLAENHNDILNNLHNAVIGKNT